MPANLPPQYFDAEKEYKNAKTTPEKIAALEAMMAIMPKHKGTDKLRAGLTRKIAQLKLQSESRAKTKKGSLYSITKQGAAQVILVGMPNTGKSSILDALTNATPDIADYPYTTVVPVIGMMEYKDIQIQVIDVPPLADEVRKLPYYNLLRTADALIVVVDGSDDPATELQLILDELQEGKVFSPLTSESAIPIGAVRKRMLVVISKCDCIDPERVALAVKAVVGQAIEVTAVSTSEGTGIDNLREEIFAVVDIIRVYTKAPGKKADLADPYVIHAGCTVMDLAREIHRDFADGLRFSRVWGSSKFDGQPVQRDYILQDGDIIELHLR